MNRKVLFSIIGLTLIIIITMGLFNFSKSNKDSQNKFVTNDQFQINIMKQVRMTPQTMSQLRKLNVTEDKELKLEYFFYTNTADKAKLFAEEIAKLNYEVHHGLSPGDKKLYIITGWTAKMKMSDSTVSKWAEQMCELGYKFDCDFDGWGTSPDQ